MSSWLPRVSIVTSRDPLSLETLHYPRDGTEPERVQETEETVAEGGKDHRETGETTETGAREEEKTETSGEGANN